MKQLFILFFIFTTYAATAQSGTVLEKMNNTIFVFCDSTATPMFKDGKVFYFIFDETGRIDLRAGADISEAFKSPFLYTGTWAVKENTVLWEWTESKKIGSATFDEESGNLLTKVGMIYRFIQKY
jgi:hypothetical protein